MTPTITRRKFLKFLALGTATVLIPAIPTFEKPVTVQLTDIYSTTYVPWPVGKPIEVFVNPLVPKGYIYIVEEQNIWIGSQWKELEWKS